MNRIIHVNLGGYALTIDDDAYEYLQSYLDNIKRRFSESDGRDEIMRDVEARLGELITQYLGAHTIVMLPHVQSAVEIMGKPEDFGGEAADGSRSRSTFGGGFNNTIRTGKKLFRDEDDAVIGGVCSGLTAYFGLNDTIWMRLIFVLLALVSAGFWVPVYVLLWIIVPAARSTGDRLAMKGEPINVDNIAREFEKGYDRLSKKMQGSTASFNQGMSSGAATGCLNVFGKLFLGLLILIAASMVLGLGSAWVAGMIAFFTAQPYLEYFSPLSVGWTYMGAFSLFLVLGLPLIGISLWIARRVFQFSTPRWLSAGLGGFWTASLLSLIVIGAAAIQKVRTGASVNKSVDLSGLQSDTLHVRWSEVATDRDDNDWFFNDASVYLNGEKLELRDFVRIKVRKSESDRFECRQTIYARGASNNEALENASQTQFNTVLEGAELKVPNRLTIEKGAKWWVRNVTINIYVPEGKCIVFDDKIYQHATAELDDYAEDIDGNYISRTPGMFYKMTKNGLTCSSCPSFGDTNYRSDRNYEEFILEGNLEVELRRADEFSLVIEGDKNNVQTIRSGDQLTLTAKAGGAPPRIVIQTPTLRKLMADNTGPVTIRGFEEGQVMLSAKGKSGIKAYIDANSELEVALSGSSTLELTGEGNTLRANLSDDAVLEANTWRAEEARVNAADNARAKVFANQKAYIKSKNAGDVKVDGPADVKRDN